MYFIIIFQYKIKTLRFIVEIENWQPIEASNIVTDAEIIENNNKIQEILDNKSEVVLYLHKCEQYIMKILKIYLMKIN